MLDRQEEKISRSLMTICNVFCFGWSDYWRKRIMCSGFVSIMNSFFGKVFGKKADKYCSILKYHRCNSKAHRVLRFEMTKILKEKGFNNALPGQKLCRQCATKYEKLTKPPKIENMTEIIKTERAQWQLSWFSISLQWQTTDKASLVTVTSTCEEYKTLWYQQYMS